MESAQITSNSPSRYQDTHLEVDFKRKSVTLDSRRLVLTRKEYELFSLLVDNAGEIIPRGGYLLHSGSPYRLWFRFGLGSGVKNPIEGNWFDRYSLLHEAKEDLAAAF
jgi:hypothetical protein